MILMECKTTIPIEKIHSSSQIIINTLGGRLQDIVPAYHSIAVFTSMTINELKTALENAEFTGGESLVSKEIIELPICYEKGVDLDRVARHSGSSIDEVIATHLEGIYRSVFIGFTPGFIYADGLNERLTCPRLDDPRRQIPAGSVGIAGNQTGIYSLDSPGGWNIVGCTPKKIFDAAKEKPMLIDVGMRYKFYRITKEDFDSWES